MRAAILVVGMALMPGVAWSAATCQARSAATTGNLLELYTSEGCSSCPPADRWFGELSADADSQGLSLLAFHVDYWDDIGWPDRFAQHAFTLRQSSRARAGGSSTVYTPQVMLSSRLDLRWNKPAQVVAALAEAGRKPSGVELQLSARPNSDKWLVEIRASQLLRADSNPRIYLAMYENGLSSTVKAGENAGSTLRHERVVRGLWGPWPLAATGTTRALQVTAPKLANPANLGFTAFVQDEKSGVTLQALSLALKDCATAGENSPAL